MGILTRAYRSIARRKTRSLLTIVVLTLALMMILVLPPSINARQNITQQAIKHLTDNSNYLKDIATLSATEIECSYPITMNMSPSSVEGEIIWDRCQPLINETLRNSIASIPDVIDTMPTLINQASNERTYFIYGVSIDDVESVQKVPTLLPVNITQGRNLQAGDRGVVVLDEMLAQNLSTYVGGTVTILGYPFTVIGIEGKFSMWYEVWSRATMSLPDAWAITNSTGQASTYKIFVNSIDNVNTVVTRLKNLDHQLNVKAGFSELNNAQSVQNQITTLNDVAQSNLNQIRVTGVTEMSVAIIANVIVILFIMSYSVRERTKEIGIIKAMGASTSKVLGQFMLEGVLLNVISVIIAIALSLFFTTYVASLMLPTPIQTGISIGYEHNGTIVLGHTFLGDQIILPGQEPSNFITASITPLVMLLGLGVAVLLGVLGSLYPALKAARIRPVEAMRFDE